MRYDAINTPDNGYSTRLNADERRSAADIALLAQGYSQTPNDGNHAGVRAEIERALGNVPADQRPHMLAAINNQLRAHNLRLATGPNGEVIWSLIRRDLVNSLQPVSSVPEHKQLLWLNID